MPRLGTALLLSVCLALVTAPYATASLEDDSASSAVVFYRVVPVDASFRIGPARTANDPLPICEIQGPGLSSPYEGEVVSTEGNIVTVPTPNGFFMQMPEQDPSCDPEASLGLFVFTGTNSFPDVEAGDQVTVEGEVQEFFDWTQLAGSPSYTVAATGRPLPDAVVFDAQTPSPEPSDVPELESYESMLIEMDNAVVTSPTNQHGVFHVDTGGELSVERTFRGPGVTYPGLEDHPDLPVWDGNPQIFGVEPGDMLEPIEMELPRGASGIEADGVLTFGFGEYRLWPTSLTVADIPEPVRPVRNRENDEFIVATLNLQNLVRPTNPGAPYERKLDKLSLHIREVMKAPEILGVQEVGSEQALQDLADRLNSDDSSLQYAAYTNPAANNASNVHVGFLYREMVDVDAFTSLGADETMPGSNLPVHDRPPLLLEGTVETAGGLFPISVLVVHNRSRIGVEGDNPDFARQKRFEQATSIADMVQNIQQDHPHVRLVILGDFNDFEFTDGLVDMVRQIAGTVELGQQLLDEESVVDPPLMNHTLAVPPEERYSYVFEGTAQVLDHILTSSGVDLLPMEVQFARANVDVPYSFSTDTNTPAGASDHDGVALFVAPQDPECPFPMIAEGEIDSSERTVPVSIEDAAGIAYVNFTDPDDNPRLDNLRVVEVPGGFTADEDSIRFTAEEGNLPTQAEFVLQSTEMDPTVPVEGVYFVTVGNGCGSEISVDPPVEFEEQVAEEIAVGPNYPNPFTTTTTLRYTLPEASTVTIRIYDMLGRHVATLVDEAVEAGEHTVTWDGRDRAGRPVASGTYLYRFQAGDMVKTGSMTLVR